MCIHCSTGEHEECDCEEHDNEIRVLQSEIARLTAEAERHQMTEVERGAVAAAAEEFAMLASVNDDDVARWHAVRARSLQGYLDRTEPDGK